MALHRPRLFIIEAGNSFGLMANYAAAHGLTVNKISLRPGSCVTLPLFADAWRLVEQAVTDAEPPEDEESDGDDQRDVLGEMEITARLMITGGEAKEDARLTWPDRAMIRRHHRGGARLLCGKAPDADPGHPRRAVWPFPRQQPAGSPPPACV